MTPDMHGRFADLRGALVRAGKAAEVFVPVGPPEEAEPRLLFIGQATKGWDEPCLRDYEAAWRRAVELVAAPLPESKIWQFIRRVMVGIGSAVGIPDLSDRLPEVIGWSNLTKVGHPRRNPSLVSRRAQADLCIEQLRHELAVMRPSAVIVMTADFAEKEILLPVFGESGWTHDVPREDRVAWKVTDVPVVWTNHPRNMGRTGYLAASVETTVTVIGEHMSRIT